MPTSSAARCGQRAPLRAGPSHGGPPSTSSGRGRPRLARRPRRVLPAAASAPTCRRVGARLRRGDRVVAPRGSRLHERSERPQLALSAGGQLQHRRPRRSPLYGDHVVSARDKVSSTRAGRAKEGRLSRWQPSAGCSMRPHARCQHEWSRGGRALRTGRTDRFGAVYSTSRTVGSMAFECMGRAKNW